MPRRRYTDDYDRGYERDYEYHSGGFYQPQAFYPHYTQPHFVGPVFAQPRVVSQHPTAFAQPRVVTGAPVMGAFPAATPVSRVVRPAEPAKTEEAKKDEAAEAAKAAEAATAAAATTAATTAATATTSAPAEEEGWLEWTWNTLTAPFKKDGEWNLWEVALQGLAIAAATVFMPQFAFAFAGVSLTANALTVAGVNLGLVGARLAVYNGVWAAGRAVADFVGFGDSFRSWTDGATSQVVNSVVLGGAQLGGLASVVGAKTTFEPAVMAGTAYAVEMGSKFATDEEANTNKPRLG